MRRPRGFAHDALTLFVGVMMVFAFCGDVFAQDPPPGDEPPPGGEPPPPGDEPLPPGDEPPPPGDEPPPPGDEPPPGDGPRPGDDPDRVGDEGGQPPKLIEVCDDDGTCRTVVEVCNANGECRELGLDECRQNDRCAEFLAGGPGRPGDDGGGDRPDEPGGPVREVCSDDGTDCRKVVDICDASGECREISLEECEQDESCREMLAGGPPHDGGIPGDDEPLECDPSVRPESVACNDDGTECRDLRVVCDPNGQWVILEDGEPGPRPGDGPDEPGHEPPVREICDALGNCEEVIEFCLENGECRDLALDECRQDDKCRELLAGGQPGDGGRPDIEPPVIHEVCDDDGNCEQVVEFCRADGECRQLSLDECEQDENCRQLLAGGPPGDGGQPDVGPPPIREICDALGNCEEVIEFCLENGECRDLALDECRQDERCRELLAGERPGGPPGDGVLPPMRVEVCDDEGNCHEAIEICTIDGECRQLSLDECRQNERCAEFLDGAPGRPGEDPDGLKVSIHEVCSDDGNECQEIVEICRADGEACRELPLEQCEQDESCRELLAGGVPGDDGGVDDGPPPFVREVCNDDGTECRQVVEFCDETGACRDVAVDECRQDERCRELLADGRPDGPPGDGVLPPMRVEICDDEGNCEQVVEICRADGECRQLSLEECEQDENCRQLLAGGPPGDGGQPDVGPPPIREICDALGNCEEVIEFCLENGECRDLALDECRQDDKCRELLAGGRPDGPPGEGGSPPMRVEICDDEGNCHEAIEICSAEGDVPPADPGRVPSERALCRVPGRRPGSPRRGPRRTRGVDPRGLQRRWQRVPRGRRDLAGRW